MSRHILGRLAEAGIVERCRRQSTLRVTPRFIAHAQRTGPDDPVQAIQHALATWDAFHGNAAASARYLHDLLADRDQLGPLRPEITMLDRFAAGA